MSLAGPLEDRIAIRELLDTHADAVNRADAETWAATKASDGVWSLPGIMAADIARRDAIVATWRAAMRQFNGVICLTMPNATDAATIQVFEERESEAALGRHVCRPSYLATRACLDRHDITDVDMKIGVSSQAGGRA